MITLVHYVTRLRRDLDLPIYFLVVVYLGIDIVTTDYLGELYVSPIHMQDHF